MKKLVIAAALGISLTPNLIHAQTYDLSSRVLSLPSLSVNGKSYTNVQVRLNAIEVISITDPSTETAGLEQWYGDWSGTYNGGDMGTCSYTISASTSSQARVSGSCTSSYGYGTFRVSGYLQANGSLYATSTSGAVFSGTATGNSISGSWNNSAALVSGTLTASKR